MKSVYSTTISNGRDCNNRLYHFAEFWKTRRERKEETGYKLLSDLEVSEAEIRRFVIAPNLVNPVHEAQPIINQAFMSKFLPWSKVRTI